MSLLSSRACLHVLSPSPFAPAPRLERSSAERSSAGRIRLAGVREGTRWWTHLGVIALVIAAGVALGARGSSFTLRAASSSGGRSYWTSRRLENATPFRSAYFRQPRGISRLARVRLESLRVGALFVHSASGNHFCTASVVRSPKKDLLITAAHCIHEGRGGTFRSDVVFIPGYRDGRAPYGVWSPARLVVAPQWVRSSNPNYDVGFVVLKPHRGRSIESLLGANRLEPDAGYHHLVRVTGYPASASAPITCINWTRRESRTQLGFDCTGFTGGTSGSPWVTRFNHKTHTGTIVGVIGGYQQGGVTPSISYSSYLGSGIAQLYHHAETLQP